MNARFATAVFTIGLLLAGALSTQAESEREYESQPREDEIAEDCVAFVRATKALPAQTPSADCPACSTQGAEVLTFRQMHIDRISCSAAGCDVTVALRVSFNPETRGTINGGLTAWIPPEQRQAFVNGRAPAGEQTYRVKIVYKRMGERWRAIEFDTPESTPSPVASGIEGVILVSPSRPGPLRRDSPGPAPAPNVIFTVMKAEARVTTFTTDAEGRFRISLPEGSYQILRDDPGARIGHWRFEAEVKRGEMTTVRWIADSGMR